VSPELPHAGRRTGLRAELMPMPANVSRCV